MKNKVVLIIPVMSDWDGAQMLDGGSISLRTIEFNRSRWEAPVQLSSIVIPDGGQLVLRREGRLIYIERGSNDTQPLNS